MDQRLDRPLVALRVQVEEHLQVGVLLRLPLVADAPPLELDPGLAEDPNDVFDDLVEPVPEIPGLDHPRDLPARRRRRDGDGLEDKVLLYVDNGSAVFLNIRYDFGGGEQFNPDGQFNFADLYMMQDVITAYQAADFTRPSSQCPNGLGYCWRK